MFWVVFLSNLILGRFGFGVLGVVIGFILFMGWVLIRRIWVFYEWCWGVGFLYVICFVFCCGVGIWCWVFFCLFVVIEGILVSFFFFVD